eukprot:3564814-Rhodomonas_salina.1
MCHVSVQLDACRTCGGGRDMLPVAGLGGAEAWRVLGAGVCAVCGWELFDGPAITSHALTCADAAARPVVPGSGGGSASA